MHCGQRFWCGLRKDQDHESQGRGTNRKSQLAAQPDRHDADQRRRRYVDSVIAEQDQADKAVGPLQKFVRESCAVVAGSHLMAQLVPVQAHQGGLRA